MASEFRTPLKRVRGLGSAKYGTQHFWHQRVTAYANVALTLFLVGLVVSLSGQDYSGARAALGSMPVAIGLLALILAGVWHMKLGMQVIIEDYVHDKGALTVALLLNTFFSAAIGIACVLAVIKMVLAG